MSRRRLTMAEKFDLLEKTDWHCAYCGCYVDVRSMVVDHMISLHNRGADKLENMVPACEECNYYKGGCNPPGFKNKLKKAFKRNDKCYFVQELEKKYAGWDGKFYFERSQGEVSDD